MSRSPRRSRLWQAAPALLGAFAAWGCASEQVLVVGARDPVVADDTAVPSPETPPARWCAPVIWQRHDHAIEGAPVVLQAGCTEQTGEVRWQWSADLPARGEVDAAELTLLPGLSNAGPHRVVLLAQSEAGIEAAELSVWVDDAWSGDDNAPVDPLVYTQEAGLPVLHLSTEAGVASEPVPATITWDGASYVGEAELRGASSGSYPKQSYLLRFADDQQLDLSARGLGSMKRLVLISLFDDNAYARQELVFATWRAMAEGRQRLTPRSFFVVVYQDGAYHGLYTAIDHVNDEMVRQLGFDDSGGLFKAVSHDANFRELRADGSERSTWHDGWEKKEGEPEGDYSDLDAFLQFAAGAPAEGFADALAERADTDEIIDWYLLVTWMAAGDSGGKNAYLYHDPADGRFRYCPWDMNHSLGQDWRTLRVASDRDDRFENKNRLFELLRATPDGRARLQARWHALVGPGGALHGAVLTAKLDAALAQVERAATRDAARWGEAYLSYGGWSSLRSGADDWLTRDQEIERLRQWIADRAAWAEAYAW